MIVCYQFTVGTTPVKFSDAYGTVTVKMVTFEEDIPFEYQS